MNKIKLLNIISLSFTTLAVIVEYIGIKLEKNKIAFVTAMTLWGIGCGILTANLILQYC